MGPLIPIVAAMLPSLIGALRKPKSAASDTTSDFAALLQQMPQLAQLLNQQSAQATEGAALRSAMTNLSTRLLPRSAFAGMSAPSTPTTAPFRQAVPRQPMPPSAF